MSRLPGRIVAVMIGTIAVFILTVAVSVLWMTRAMDNKARQDSARLVESALENLLSGMDRVNLEYAKWDALAQATEQHDMDWLYLNMGVTAATGLMSDLVVLWGGPFDHDIGWLDESAPAGLPGVLSPSLLEQVDHSLAAIPIRSMEGLSFFAWHDQTLFAAAVARVEWTQDTSRIQTDDAHIARLLMGHRVTDQDIDAIAEATLLGGFELERTVAQDRPSIPLRSAGGTPVAWLAWNAPKPGTELFWRLLPFLLGTTLAAGGLVCFGMMLVRRNAQRLVASQNRACAAARTDPLTGLPNRAAFNNALAKPALVGERAILFLDVNDFKRINDSIGHAAGDQVIVGLAQRLATFVGTGCFAARIAGDEFVFVVTGAEAEQQTRQLAEAAEVLLAQPFNVLGHRMQISLAMGYAVQATGDMTGDDLVRQADLAMYEAKRHRGQGVVAFSAVIEHASRDAAVIERGLRRALTHPGEISIAYQPIVGSDGCLVRAEALARWTSPELGPVPPDRFIAVAEQAGLIVDLGRYLLHLICDDLVSHPELAVSVNVSTLQLMAPDFVPSLVSEVRKRGVTPGRIEIELTEAVLVDDVQIAARRLRELHAAGFTTALDDFGTGYSSVGYLEQLGFQTLKIDRSFVEKIRNSTKGVVVVSGIITMAHGFDLKVVCEGIETAAELDLLRELGCDLAQGFYLDRPLPISVLAARWLAPATEQAEVAPRRAVSRIQ